MRFLVAIVVASQALADGGSVLVCRYTGRIMDPCACPHERQQPSDRATLQDQGCCELRKSEAPATAVLAKATPPAPTKYADVTWLSLAPSRTSMGASRTVFVAARQQAPPSTPLYITIRSLLI